MECHFYAEDGQETVLSAAPVEAIPEKAAASRQRRITSEDRVTLSHARERGAVERGYLGARRVTPQDRGVRLPAGVAAVSLQLLPAPVTCLAVMRPSEAQGPGNESAGLNIWFQLVAPLDGPPEPRLWVPPTQTFAEGEGDGDRGGIHEMAMSIRLAPLRKGQGASYLGRDMQFYSNPALVEGRGLDFFVHVARVARVSGDG